MREENKAMTREAWNGRIRIKIHTDPHMTESLGGARIRYKQQDQTGAVNYWRPSAEDIRADDWQPCDSFQPGLL